MKMLHFEWKWDLQTSPSILWPLLSDTDRFNRDLGFPEVEILSYSPRETRFSVKKMRLKGPLPIEWEEYPFEWAEPHHFGIERVYSRGPFRSFKMSASMEALKSGGTRLFYEAWIEPKNKLGEIIAKFELGRNFPRKAENLLRAYDQRLQIKKKPEAKNSFLTAKLAAFSKTSPLARRFCSWLQEAPELELHRIRPYALAKTWNVPRQDLLKIFLLAAKEGFLDFQWEVICPHCRGSEKAVSNLEEIENKSYCTYCQIHFTVSFEKLVELTFRPHASIRKINRKLFCSGGPQASPHILLQNVLRPGEEKVLTVTLPPGTHRVRVARSPMQALFQTGENAAGTVEAEITSKAVALSEGLWNSSSILTVTNKTSEKQLLLVERMAWTEDSLNARGVLHMPLFRDLFSAQRLRPGEQISFGNLTFVFTDLKGSTRLYQEIGDPAAFGTVIHHFDILRDAVLAHDGILVKTIGDAVMAVFDRPSQALLAAASAQRHLSSPEQGQPLLLKAGIHYGPALGVTLNEKLDYFGTAVNIAARLVTLSSGEDIILSSSTAEDPEIKLLTTVPNAGTRFENFQTAIKGFGEEQFSLIRFVPNCPKK